MTASPPIVWTPRALSELSRFGALWQGRLAVLQQHSPCPPWCLGQVITPAFRALYESYLPIAEFCHGLGVIAAHVLPHRSWVPRVLRTRLVHLERRVAVSGPPGILDLWAMMPKRLAGRVEFGPDEVGMLFCALADPRRFGTNVARYPRQDFQIRQWLDEVGSARSAVRILDLACGVGAGTLEVVDLVRRMGHSVHGAMGVTREPLEAWMARARCLPHSPRRQGVLRGFKADASVRFCAGDVRLCPCGGVYDAILCNGLVGGPELADIRDTEAFLATAARLLAANGRVFIANSFHEGYRRGVEMVLQQALAQGWRVEGSWRALVFREQGR